MLAIMQESHISLTILPLYFLLSLCLSGVSNTNLKHCNSVSTVNSRLCRVMKGRKAQITQNQSRNVVQSGFNVNLFS
jgi:hypothetical protein